MAALKEILEKIPVQVKYEYEILQNDPAPWKVYRWIYCSGDGKRRRVDTQVIDKGVVILHDVLIFHLDSETYYLVDPLFKTFQVVVSWWNPVPESEAERRILEVKYEEPDPHLFLITADLQEHKDANAG